MDENFDLNESPSLLYSTVGEESVAASEISKAVRTTKEANLSIMKQ